MADMTTAATSRPRWQARRKLLLTAAALALVLIVVVLGWTATSARDPGGPPDAEWCQKVRRLPAAGRVRIVLDRLEALNPNYRRRYTEWTDLEVIEFSEITDHLKDIRPMGALSDLKVLALTGSKLGQGRLTDIEPLQNMKIIRLDLARNPGLENLAPLRGMPLFKVDLADTGVQSLDDLADAPLMDLNIARTWVSDLSPLRNMTRLQVLDCSGCPIVSLAPLAHIGLVDLQVDFQRERDTPVLMGIASLQIINGLPVKQFWKFHGK